MMCSISKVGILLHLGPRKWRKLLLQAQWQLSAGMERSSWHSLGLPVLLCIPRLSLRFNFL